ncbi:hypothetical protein M409DRAFT_49525 [Zasmidium cellare ATCC 36951]|uniref:Uncharacterized protein n=1 Tax=Zasmidium cellare ATCC 36951 TaxID=1080233 RepID=A0A6A6D0N7_ZASCE|nr:uncharacterized protein M409DRAFT_49525 [Zasmidium cellare ATCC 36951]KAF2173027.1 hypothetical protein M409DRAFT_49525 [Zasmidium cellare ATCC 36951]
MGEDDTNNHPDTSASTPNSNSAAQNNTKAAKDRSCPFCGQAFTSSSLGRHLDLYIKPKNPKPADGVHDVEEIEKIRGGITRRQPRTSIKNSGDGQSSGGTRDNSHTPGHGSAGRHAHADSTIVADSPVISPVNADKIDSGQTLLNHANWQATGVINNLPPRAPSRNDGPATGQAQRINEMRRDTGGNKIQRPEYESEGMWKLQEAAELGRAAEMALREVLGSLEAAQKKTESKALFEDFDFYSLSFPGLCLAILPPPTTLFSPTPFPSAESWTLGPPGLRQFEAMTRFVNEKFNDKRKREGALDSVAFRHHSHLSGAWEHWQNMSEADRSSAWTLEILRSFTRGQEQRRQLRTELERSQQRVRHLEAEYDRLSRCQLPREYLLHPPNTVQIPPNVMREVKPSQFKSDISEMGFDAEALLSKWRSTIRATARPSRTAQQTSGTPSSAIYNEQSTNSLRDDMVMNGSIWNVNGPIPRQRPSHTETIGQIDSVSYETPPNPGAVVEGADDEEGNSNADAEGEAEDEAAAFGNYAEQNALMRRQDMLGNGGLSSVMNANGKRPLAPSGGRSGTKMYKISMEDNEG